MKKIVFLIIIVIISSSLFAQETTVEQRYLSTSIEIAIATELAAAETREQKLIALDTIEQMVNDGKIKQDDIQINNVLTSLAGEGTFIVVREGTRKVNDFPEVRTRAAKVLGELGGEKSKNTLIDITTKEYEPMVLSQTVFALGIIGLNDNNESLLAIARVLEANSRRAPLPDDNLAIAALLAIEKIAAKNNGFPSEPDPRFLYRAIIEVQQGNYSTNVRKWAENLIQKLRQY
ncbi:MAG: HEAT repeat domain-containing protein [Spirochaetaceae bacterium]|nr:HEAT repeat domain-containing protein [Spirochaetaceae bacterium]